LWLFHAWLRFERIIGGITENELHEEQLEEEMVGNLLILCVNIAECVETLQPMTLYFSFGS